MLFSGLCPYMEYFNIRFFPHTLKKVEFFSKSISVMRIKIRFFLKFLTIPLFYLKSTAGNELLNLINFHR